MTNEEAIKILEYPVKKWSMEWDEREDGLSYYEALDMAISALRQQDVADRDVGKNEPLTNAQKIRAMTDEELAWELMLWRCEAVARHHGISSVYPDTQKTILEWLQQPAEEDDNDRES